MASCGTSQSILINATNLHVGGGVQVAVSFIKELSLLVDSSKKIDVAVSSFVDKNLKACDVDLMRFNNYEVVDSYGILSFFSRFSRKASYYDVVFTVFGPYYSFFCPRIHIVGFAQAWIAYPSNEVYSLLSWLSRFKLRLKFFLQKHMFKQADYLIVELEHIREQLLGLNLVSEPYVKVVHNAVASLYFTEPKPPLPLTDKRPIVIGYVGRNYIHKNTAILPYVKDILRDRHGINVIFHVTFNESEWSKLPDNFKKSVYNFGELDVTDCQEFYETLDAVIFPSLLECFSATPLEALAMMRPLFASDRPFVHDVCGDHAFYFNPLDPTSIAEVIAHYFNEQVSSDQRRLEMARFHALHFSSAYKRAQTYLNLIDQVIPCKK